MADTSAATAINSILTGIMQNSVLRFTFKALAFGAISAIDCYLGGGDTKDIIISALLGIASGFAISAVISKALALCTTIETTTAFLRMTGIAVLTLGGMGAKQSIEEGHYKQALYRAFLSLCCAGASFSKANKIEFGVKAKTPEVKMPKAGKTSYGKSSVDLTKPKGWKVGDTIDNLTKSGRKPSWSTVRARYWKNKAYYNSNRYSESNLIRMKKGLAPIEPETGASMELHHINGRNIKNPHSIENLQEVWSWQHDKIDSF